MRQAARHPITGEVIAEERELRSCVDMNGEGQCTLYERGEPRSRDAGVPEEDPPAPPPRMRGGNVGGGSPRAAGGMPKEIVALALVLMAGVLLAALLVWGAG